MSSSACAAIPHRLAPRWTSCALRCAPRAFHTNEKASVARGLSLLLFLAGRRFLGGLVHFRARSGVMARFGAYATFFAFARPFTVSVAAATLASAISVACFATLFMLS